MHVSYLAIFSALAGVLLLLNFREGSSKLRLFSGVALLLVMTPALYSYDQLGEVFKSDIVWSVGGIVIGALIVWLMVDLFANTSPTSTSFNQWMFFGYFKWDDFAQYLLIGLLMLGVGMYTLFQSTSRAITYRGAYDSIKKCEREKTQQTSPEKRDTAPKLARTSSKPQKTHPRISNRIAVNKKAHAAN